MDNKPLNAYKKNRATTENKLTQTIETPLENIISFNSYKDTHQDIVKTIAYNAKIDKWCSLMAPLFRKMENIIDSIADFVSSKVNAYEEKKENNH